MSNNEMRSAHFGMIGLGTMGRNFLLNIADSGIAGVGYDLDAAKRELLLAEATGLPLSVGTDLADFLNKLESPRNVMLLVPAGRIVDKVIADLFPHLAPNDLIIDGGNSHYADTERRMAELDAKGVGFLGVGVSGGEEGARRGASIMPGGKLEFYERIESSLQAVSAKVDGEPCVAYMGAGSAGHFVKMVHNGIEYGLMQLIAETYDFMRRVLAMTSSEIADTFSEWNTGILNSFLIEIAATVLRKVDVDTGGYLVEKILDTAGQKGTGKWTSQAAMDLGVPVPTIDSAVSMRQISARRDLRSALSVKYKNDLAPHRESVSTATLHEALYAGFILTYAQGLSMLRAASEEKGFGVDLVEVARIWRGGCIIRAALLEEIRTAFAEDRWVGHLLLNDSICEKVSRGAAGLRETLYGFNRNGIPAMCLSASLNYFDAFRTGRLPANLIQAQRDYFGAHTYQRIDREGTFHTPDWKESD